MAFSSLSITSKSFSVSLEISFNSFASLSPFPSDILLFCCFEFSIPAISLARHENFKIPQIFPKFLTYFTVRNAKFLCLRITCYSSRVNFSMAKTKFEYTRKFENNDSCLLNCFIVVRLDGRNFHRCVSLLNFYCIYILVCVCGSWAYPCHLKCVWV